MSGRYAVHAGPARGSDLRRTRSAPSSQSPTASTNGELVRAAVLAEQVHLVRRRARAPRPAARCRRSSRSRAAGSRGRSRIRMRARAGSERLRRPLARVRGVSTSSATACARPPRAARSCSRPSPAEIYRDRDTGEQLEVVGKVLPLAPSPVAAAVGGREPALLQLVRPARPAGPERLPDVRAAHGAARVLTAL